MSNLLITYKLGTRMKGDLSAAEGVKVHLFHAQANNDKVLFSTDRGPSPENRDRISEIILTTKYGDFAVRATVDSLGKFSAMQPPPGYLVPSIYTEAGGNRAWFALSNLRQITINPGDFTSVNGKDLLESISSKAYMAYVDLGD